LGEKEKMCMWSAKAFQAFALGATWEKIAQLV
jgi:hypothetical protein